MAVTYLGQHNTILVTGGAGLLGNALIRQLLAEGKDVTALYNKTPMADFPPERVRQIRCDILDVAGLELAMHGIKQVYHCAAIVSFNPKLKRQLFKVNVEGTANIVNAALEAGVQKIVHVSSVAALGRLRDGETVTEKMQWTEAANSSNYGQSKYLGELEVWRGVGEGLDAVVVNPVIILGDGDWNGGSSKLFKSIYDGFPWYSTGVSGFVDVNDVAKAMIRLMDSPVSGERFIISAENKTYREVFDMIAKAFGKKTPHKAVTPLIAKIVWRLEALKSRFTGSDPLVTEETARTALDKVMFDNSKLKTFLPDFTYTPLQQTIAETCRLLQQKLNS